MALFEVDQLFLRGGDIISSTTNAPTFHRLSLASGTIDCDPLFVYGKGIISVLDVNDFVQEDILICQGHTVHKQFWKWHLQ